MHTGNIFIALNLKNNRKQENLNFVFFCYVWCIGNKCPCWNEKLFLKIFTFLWKTNFFTAIYHFVSIRNLDNFIAFAVKANSYLQFRPYVVYITFHF